MGAHKTKSKEKKIAKDKGGEEERRQSGSWAQEISCSWEEWHRKNELQPSGKMEKQGAAEKEAESIEVYTDEI